MIKAKNSSKIPKIPGNFPKKKRKFPENSLENPKNLPPSFAWRMGGSGLARQGGISQKIFNRGVFWLYPLAHLCTAITPKDRLVLAFWMNIGQNCLTRSHLQPFLCHIGISIYTLANPITCRQYLCSTKIVKDYPGMNNWNIWSNGIKHMKNIIFMIRF